MYERGIYEGGMYEGRTPSVLLLYCSRMGSESCHGWEGVMSRVGGSHVTHVHESCQAFEWGVGHEARHILE